jgi:ABC-type transport system involved in multi-copper enzyme maturation permease subunit
MSFPALARLHWRQMLGGRRFLAIFGFVLLPVLLAAAVRLAGGFRDPAGADLEGMTIFLFVLYGQIVCMLLALLDGALLLSTELEGQTLGYLFTRPISKWRILLSKYVAGVLVTAPLVAASAVAAHGVFLFAGGPRILSTLVVTAVAGVAAYNAIYALLGTLFPKRAIVICLVYSGIVEFGLSYFPVVLNELTASYGLRSLALALSEIDVPDDVRMVLGTAGPVASILKLAIVTAVALFGAALVLTRRSD